MIDHLLQALISHKTGLPGRERVQFGLAGCALLAKGARKAQRSADLATNFREGSLGACCGSPQTAKQSVAVDQGASRRAKGDKNTADDAADQTAST